MITIFDIVSVSVIVTVFLVIALVFDWILFTYLTNHE